MKKRNRIIAAVNKQYHKQTHKYGIKVRKTVQEAIQLDKENGNTLWQEAIAKEMDAVGIAFRILEEDSTIPPGYSEIECYMIFTVKLEDFRRKARFVAGGHLTETPWTH